MRGRVGGFDWEATVMGGSPPAGDQPAPDTVCMCRHAKGDHGQFGSCERCLFCDRFIDVLNYPYGLSNEELHPDYGEPIR